MYLHNYFNQNFSSEVSKTRVGYVNFYNNDFGALWDCYKVFRLNKNNFLDNFSFISNWKWNFSSIFYGKPTFLAPKSIILIRARASENWQSEADCRKWPSLGSKLTTFIDEILSKLLFKWVKKRFNLYTLIFYLKQNKEVQLDWQSFEIFISSSLLPSLLPGKLLEEKLTYSRVPRGWNNSGVDILIIINNRGVGWSWKIVWAVS